MSNDSPTLADAQALAQRFRLDGQVAIVTGAGSGIGRGTAEAFAAAGAHVVATDLDGDTAAATVAGIESAGGKGEAHAMDVADEASVVSVIGDAAARLGRIDVLFNSAGIAVREPTEEATLEAWNKVVAVNMTGSFLCAREAGKQMLKQGRGSIVNVASMWGLVGGPFYGNLSYHTTKGAVVQMTRALAVEWGPRGVRVNAIAPTFVRTPMAQHMFEGEWVDRVTELAPLTRGAEPVEMLGGILYLASEASSMVTGVTLPIDGGWTAR